MKRKTFIALDMAQPFKCAKKSGRKSSLFRIFSPLSSAIIPFTVWIDSELLWNLRIALFWGSKRALKWVLDIFYSTTIKMKIRQLFDEYFTLFVIELVNSNPVTPQKVYEGPRSRSIWWREIETFFEMSRGAIKIFLWVIFVIKSISGEETARRSMGLVNWEKCVTCFIM